MVFLLLLLLLFSHVTLSDQRRENLMRAPFLMSWGGCLLFFPSHHWLFFSRLKEHKNSFSSCWFLLEYYEEWSRGELKRTRSGVRGVKRRIFFPAFPLRVSDGAGYSGSSISTPFGTFTESGSEFFWWRILVVVCRCYFLYFRSPFRQTIRQSLSQVNVPLFLSSDATADAEAGVSSSLSTLFSRFSHPILPTIFCLQPQQKEVRLM